MWKKKKKLVIVFCICLVLRRPQDWCYYCHFKEVRTKTGKWSGSQKSQWQPVVESVSRLPSVWASSLVILLIKYSNLCIGLRCTNFNVYIIKYYNRKEYKNLMYRTEYIQKTYTEFSSSSKAHTPLLTNCLKPLKPSNCVWKIIGKDWVWCTN